MKKRNSFYFAIVSTGLFCICAMGQVELPEPSNDFLLLDSHVLAGMDKVAVVIVHPDTEPNKDGLVWAELETKIINKLSKSGIKIIAGGAGNLLEINELRVSAEMLKLEDSQQYVFRIQTSFATKVSMVDEPRRYIKADIWKVPPQMQAVSVEQMPKVVTDVVLEQVEAFIAAYLAANSKRSEPAKADNIKAGTTKVEKHIVKQTAGQSKYVASKNGKVFHTADCSSAKRILPENIVNYNSREDAERDGKRPCKICKP
jgi:hypothetical protein